MNEKEWFKKAKFGMMIHFGLYSILAGEYKGKRTDQIAEWIQSYYRIPNKEYSELLNAFNPIYYNPEEWVKLAKAAGMNYIVVTTKHHEGFALFKTKVSDFSSYTSTPFKRDLIAELAEACYKYNMRLGVYYSQELDWHHPHGGGYNNPVSNEGMSWTNDWDYPDNDKKNYSICYEEKIKPQVEEILKNYGEISLVWFDTPYTISKEQSDELYNMVKKYQPNCLVNSRIGNGTFDYESAEDNVIPDDVQNHLYESPITLNDTWGFKYCDDNWKTPEKIVKIKNHLNERGANLLLNVGPDYLGRIPAPTIEILNQVGKIINT